jgi:hypothetical protein
LSAPRTGTLAASSATIALKGNTSVNVADKVGKLIVEGGPDGSLTLKKPLVVKDEINIKSVKEINGADLVAEGNLKLNNPGGMTGSAKIQLKGTGDQIISGPGSVLNLDIR